MDDLGVKQHLDTGDGYAVPDLRLADEVEVETCGLLVPGSDQNFINTSVPRAALHLLVVIVVAKRQNLALCTPEASVLLHRSNHHKLIAQLRGPSYICNIVQEKRGSCPQEGRRNFAEFVVELVGASPLVFISVQIEPARLLGELYRRRISVILCDGRNQQIAADQELAVDELIAQQDLVVGELEENRPENGAHAAVFDELSVVVLKHCVAEFERGVGGLQN